MTVDERNFKLGTPFIIKNLNGWAGDKCVSLQHRIPTVGEPAPVRAIAVHLSTRSFAVSAIGTITMDLAEPTLAKFLPRDKFVYTDEFLAVMRSPSRVGG